MDALSFIFAQLFVVLAVVAIGGVVYFAYQANLQQQQKSRSSQPERKGRKGEKRAAAPAPQPVAPQPQAPQAEEEPEEEPEQAPVVAEKKKPNKKGKKAEQKVAEKPAPAPKAAAPAAKPAKVSPPQAAAAPAKATAKAAPAKAGKAKGAAPAAAAAAPVVEEKKQEPDAKKKKKKAADKKKLKESQAAFEQNLSAQVEAVRGGSAVAPAAAVAAAAAPVAAVSKKPAKVADGEWSVIESKSAKRRENKASEEKNPSEDHMAVDPKNYSTIIGHKGKTLQALTRVTNANIQMPKQNASHQFITIKGNPSEVAQAKALIQELIANGYTKLTHPGVVSVAIEVPLEKRPILIGEKGVNIKNLQNETDTRINLPRDQSSTTVTVVGTPANCERARNAIETLINEGFSTVTHKNFVRGNVEINIESLGRLIGPAGITIQNLQINTKTKINVPKTDPKDPLAPKLVQISIVGEAPDVLAAQRKIMELIEPKEQEVERSDDPNDPWNVVNVDMSVHNKW